MLVYTHAFLKAFIAGTFNDIIGGAYSGPLAAPFVALFTGAFSPSVDTVLSQLTEATYTGYARKHLTIWSPSYVSQDGFPSLVSETALFFQPTAPVTVTNVITGYGLVDIASGGTLLALDHLSESVQLATPSDALDLTIVLQAMGLQGVGVGLVGN